MPVNKGKIMLSCTKHQQILSYLLLLFFAVIAGCPDSDLPSKSDQKPKEEAELQHEEPLDRFDQTHTGDLPELKKRQMVRVLVSYNRTNFQVVAGHNRGFEYELLKNYEKHISHEKAESQLPVRLVFIPMSFDKLFEGLIEGRGDIAASGLTITEKRRRIVDFTQPYLPKVNEIVVVHKSVNPSISSLNDLAGLKLLVTAGSSYLESIDRLNKRLRQQGLQPVEYESDIRIRGEDILEMVNAGALPATVADAHVADLWSKVLPDIVVRKDLVLNKGGQIAWAIRKNSPKLMKSLNAYVDQIEKGTLKGNIFFKRYYKNVRWIKNPVAEAERRRLGQFISLFEKYSHQYGFDWLAIAAQAYTESGLDHSKKSNAGAVGIMQVLPSTARDKKIAIPEIDLLENNIHAGIKYLNLLRNSYFTGPEIDPVDQLDFSWAAYNAGPNRINGLRRKAASKGLDPNKWFGNVEQIALEEIGTEPVRYVAKINQYYLLYKMFVNRSSTFGELQAGSD